MIPGPHPSMKSDQLRSVRLSLDRNILRFSRLAHACACCAEPVLLLLQHAHAHVTGSIVNIGSNLVWAESRKSKRAWRLRRAQPHARGVRGFLPRARCVMRRGGEGAALCGGGGMGTMRSGLAPRRRRSRRELPSSKRGEIESDR